MKKHKLREALTKSNDDRDEAILKLATLRDEYTTLRDERAELAAKWAEADTERRALRKENEHLQQWAVGWAEIVDARGQVLQAGPASTFTRDAIGELDPLESWDALIIRSPVYSTTVQFLDVAKPYRVKTEDGERLIIRERVTQ